MTDFGSHGHFEDIAHALTKNGPIVEFRWILSLALVVLSLEAIYRLWKFSWIFDGFSNTSSSTQVQVGGLRALPKSAKVAPHSASSSLAFDVRPGCPGTSTTSSSCASLICGVRRFRSGADVVEVTSMNRGASVTSVAKSEKRCARKADVVVGFPVCLVSLGHPCVPETWLRFRMRR